MRTLTTKQLAEALGVSLGTIHRYRRRGAPFSKATGGAGRPANLWSLAEVQEWREAEGIAERQRRHLEGRERLAQEVKTSQKARADAELSRARRVEALAQQAERKLAQEAQLSELGISERIQEAKTYEELADLSRWVASLVGSGDLETSRASCIGKLLQEARQNLTADLSQPEASEDPDVIYMVCADAVEVAHIHEGIICDERRARILAYVKREAAADLEEHPNTDPGEA